MSERKHLLAGLADVAVAAIRSLLTDPNTSPSVRLQAAKLVLTAIDGNDTADADSAIPIVASPTTSEPSQLAGPHISAETSAAPPNIDDSIEPSGWTEPHQKRPQPSLKTYVRYSPKIGRNDQCPCGSGLKFKKCCLANFELPIGPRPATQAATVAPINP